MKQYWKYYVAALVVILIDQATKLVVHYNMEMGAAGEIEVWGRWLRLHYILNPGMAWGIRIGFKYGKLLLTLFRLVATFVIAWKLPQIARSAGVSKLSVAGWALILGGAIGNGIDSVFYGVLLDNAAYDSPTPWFHGQVIDMICVGIEQIYIPTWIPWLGGKYLPPFPVFNVADSAITTGVGLIMLDSFLQARRKGTEPVADHKPLGDISM